MKEIVMCLTCGCMQAHKEMTEADFTYEDVKRATDQNGTTVDEVLATITKTAGKDRGEHPAEYATGTGASTVPKSNTPTWIEGATP